MSFADFVNLPSVVGAGLGATVFAWFGSYMSVKGRNIATKQDVSLLTNELKRNTELTQSVQQQFSRSDVIWRGELVFRQRQLEELYGPLYGYLKSQKEIYDIWIEGNMSERNEAVKKLFTDQNEKIRNLIVAKAHLIEGDKMPDSFVRFATSSLIFDLYAIGTEGQVPQHLRKDSRAKYPNEFNKHVYDVTEALKNRIESLNQQFAPPLELPDPQQNLDEANAKASMPA